MIKKVIIGLILLVCICSGAFSVIYHYNPTNTSDIDNTDSSNIIGNTNNEDFKSIENNPLMKYIDHIDDTLQYSYGYVINVNGELRHYITESAYYLESEGLIDRYIRCVECGGFVPIGEITNPLPKAAICHCNSIATISDYRDSSYSRDEVYSLWVEEGMQTYSEDYFNYYSNHIYSIYCKDCNGFVPLKDNFSGCKIGCHYCEDVLNIHLSAFLHEDRLCSHYNGTLDLFDTPIEDFHQGWFRSTEDYNHCLEEANKSLNENNEPIDDIVAPIESNDFTPDNTVEDLSNNTI